MSPAQAQLAERVRRDLSLLNYPGRQWVSPRRTAGAHPIFDVIIVGAGQGGLAAAFGLMRERVNNILVLDEHPLDRAGPWLNFARMLTLRTPKSVTGPDLGIPSLTPHAWYEAEYGDGSWDALGLIPKQVWAAYLSWYRQTLELPVQPDTRVGALTYDEQERAFVVPCSRGGQNEVLYARRVVLATGIDGSGAWDIPQTLRAALSPQLYAHTRDDIDFSALVGKRVAVLGAGASAFDNAATALDFGAGSVDLLFRRPSLVNINAYRWAEFVGFLKHHADLPDRDKWRFIRQIVRMGQLPPADTVRRASAHPGFRMHPGCGWTGFSQRGEAALVHSHGGDFEVDFVIVGTGFVTDLKRRPELAAIEAEIALWQDRYEPPADEREQDLLRHPYLGPHFEFSEREPGRAPYLQYLFNYTFGCLLSLGLGGASISGMKYGTARLVYGVTRSLFLEDREQHFQSLCTWDKEEF